MAGDDDPGPPVCGLGVAAARAAQTADIIAGHLPQVPRHACGLVADRTPEPSTGHRDRYPRQWLAWLDGIPGAERDQDATALRAAVEHFAVTGDSDRHELLITHNFVIGWFVRHALDAPVWRWIGLTKPPARSPSCSGNPASHRP